MSFNALQLHQTQKNKQNNDEIDLQQLGGTLRRRWRWILSGGSIGIVLSIIWIIVDKPIYQGEFQIVVDQESNQSEAAAFLAKNAGLASLAGLSSPNAADQISTEVEILNSPYVLRPVFDAVRKSKDQKNAKDLRFKKWVRESITIEQKDDTSVLNVEFRDKDKDLILPITQMMSDVYQEYSNRNRYRELDNLIAYLKSQISILKPKSTASSRKALDYGYSNGLGILDGLPLASNIAGAAVSSDDINSTKGTTITTSGGSLEVARMAAQQKVKSLEIQILEAKKAGAGSIYFASKIASLTDKSSTFDQLTLLESELAELRSRFKDNDPIVQNINYRRRALIGYINQQTLALLKGELDLAKANLEALDRPLEIVREHRELTQKALRDEATLVALQNQLMQFELERARAASPWKLISTPSLLENPVSPNALFRLSIGALFGLLIGSTSGLLTESRNGKIYNVKDLQKILPDPFLHKLYWDKENSNQRDWELSIQLLADGPLSDSNSVGIVPLGEVNSLALSSFANSLKKALGNKKNVILSSDILLTRDCSTQLLITTLGVTQREKMIKQLEQLNLQGSPIAGWLLLESNKELKV